VDEVRLLVVDLLINDPDTSPDRVFKIRMLKGLTNVDEHEVERTQVV